MRTITPCLWFDGKAEEAARFYTSLLPESRIDKVHRAGLAHLSKSAKAIEEIAEKGMAPE
jgi:predicted 3-demethylubiquinone-9 3-methyltransferase (glyoxalase superfamily)